MPIHGKTLLEIWLDLFEKYGISDVLINTHHHSAKVENFIENIKNKVEKESIRNIIKKEWKLLKKIKLFVPGSIISGTSWGMVVSYLPLLLVEKTTLSLPFIGIIIKNTYNCSNFYSY